jgi:hypothetical protein
MCFDVPQENLQRVRKVQSTAYNWLEELHTWSDSPFTAESAVRIVWTGVGFA